MFFLGVTIVKDYFQLLQYSVQTMIVNDHLPTVSADKSTFFWQNAAQRKTVSPSMAY